ncbi:hypothetical protein BO94DRAFT_301414 [Aspergillus sclerotioniger CBS 115572]|uniref:Uncharacterized protein n=1 Tax=Aspergillus sclerotioniger CBS 115572 TaxID=1450535 RepID=A0A317V6H7_9EURO|nr:hypothetical protein BO94DRAFT_301414 [Aspergillus sclerotioniger CBS 115572]PWY68547.1 hypothetical protein BO94DRAFT_301414 [Aspergillus sclerotioniger CBS 115572]
MLTDSRRRACGLHAVPNTNENGKSVHLQSWRCTDQQASSQVSMYPPNQELGLPPRGTGMTLDGVTVPAPIRPSVQRTQEWYSERGCKAICRNNRSVELGQTPLHNPGDRLYRPYKEGISLRVVSADSTELTVVFWVLPPALQPARPSTSSPGRIRNPMSMNHLVSPAKPNKRITIERLSLHGRQRMFFPGDSIPSKLRASQKRSR